MCIFLHLRNGALRFNQLQKRLPFVTPKMLTQQLRDLERSNLLFRKIYSVISPHVESSLTKYGKVFIPILKTMCQWRKTFSNTCKITIDTSCQEKVI